MKDHLREAAVSAGAKALHRQRGWTPPYARLTAEIVIDAADEALAEIADPPEVDDA